MSVYKRVFEQDDQQRRLVHAQLEEQPGCRVVIIEDEPFDAKRLSNILLSLTEGRFTLEVATTVDRALELLQEALPDLIFLNDHLGPVDTALNTMPRIRGIGYAGPIVIVSGEMDAGHAARLLAAGAGDTIDKENIDEATMSTIVQRHLLHSEELASTNRSAIVSLPPQS